MKVQEQKDTLHRGQATKVKFAMNDFRTKRSVVTETQALIVAQCVGNGFFQDCYDLSLAKEDFESLSTGQVQKMLTKEKTLQADHRFASYQTKLLPVVEKRKLEKVAADIAKEVTTVETDKLAAIKDAHSLKLFYPRCLGVVEEGGSKVRCRRYSE